MDTGWHRLPTRAARTRPDICAPLTALLVLLGLLFAAPARTEASEPPPYAVHIEEAGVPSHHGDTGSFRCYAVAACAVAPIPGSAALQDARAATLILGSPSTSLAPSSRVFAPDPPPPRP